VAVTVFGGVALVVERETAGAILSTLTARTV